MFSLGAIETASSQEGIHEPAPGQAAVRGENRCLKTRIVFRTGNKHVLLLLEPAWLFVLETLTVQLNSSVHHQPRVMDCYTFDCDTFEGCRKEKASIEPRQ